MLAETELCPGRIRAAMGPLSRTNPDAGHAGCRCSAPSAPFGYSGRGAGDQSGAGRWPGAVGGCLGVDGGFAGSASAAVWSGAAGNASGGIPPRDHSWRGAAGGWTAGLSGVTAASPVSEGGTAPAAASPARFHCSPTASGGFQTGGRPGACPDSGLATACCSASSELDSTGQPRSRQSTTAAAALTSVSTSPPRAASQAPRLKSPNSRRRWPAPGPDSHSRRSPARDLRR